MKIRRWTPQEDRTLIKQIELHPNSRKAAFEATARLLDRTVSGVANRWYTIVSLRTDTLCFATVSKTQQVNNRSRATRKAPAKKRTENWWKKVMKLLGF